LHMNIFYLDDDINKSVQYLVDKHVVKMPLETAQLLSSAIYLNGGQGPYKPTHLKHPCTLWVASDECNYIWLSNYGLALCKEYTFRYHKQHACERVILDMPAVPVFKTINKFTLPPQCMPDEYKQSNTVEAYRAYYRGAKKHIHKWTGRPVPDWI